VKTDSFFTRTRIYVDNGHLVVIPDYRLLDS